MKTWILAGVAAAALSLSACGEEGSGGNGAGAASNAPIEQIAAPNNGNWTEMVEETAEGGYRMGNPDAPVKLVEYGSITCGHCAEFSETATEPLKEKYVKSGQVSWEFRPFMLFPTDPGISMLLRCQGAGPFFRLVDQLYATQPEWAGRLQSMTPAQQAQLEGMGAQERAAALVRITGVDQFFRQRGMPGSKVEACLADQQQLDRLMEITQQGAQQGVQGTPAFLINGRLESGAGSWEQLEPRLRAALP